MKYRTRKTRRARYTRDTGSALLENIVLISVLMGLVSVTIQLAHSLDTHFTSAADILLEGELCDATLETAQCYSSWGLMDDETAPGHSAAPGATPPQFRGKPTGGRFF